MRSPLEVSESNKQSDDYNNLDRVNIPLMPSDLMGLGPDAVIAALLLEPDIILNKEENEQPIDKKKSPAEEENFWNFLNKNVINRKNKFQEQATNQTDDTLTPSNEITSTKNTIINKLKNTNIINRLLRLVTALFINKTL